MTLKRTFSGFINVNRLNDRTGVNNNNIKITMNSVFTGNNHGRRTVLRRRTGLQSRQDLNVIPGVRPVSTSGTTVKIVRSRGGTNRNQFTTTQ